MNRVDFDDWEGNQVAKRRNKRSDTEIGYVTKLGAAKQALAKAQELPDISDLIDHAEAVRAAARSLHISAEGINAWTRFIVDAERKGWSHIEAMRAAGELAPSSGGGAPRKKTGVLALKDIIDRSPSDRAREWSALAKLTEFQLNEAERIANEEDRVLTKGELIKLAKAGIPTPSKGEKERPAEEVEIVTKAQEKYSGDSIQVDDDAKITRVERGWWVGAWVWVEDELTRSDLED